MRHRDVDIQTFLGREVLIQNLNFAGVDVILKPQKCRVVLDLSDEAFIVIQSLKEPGIGLKQVRACHLNLAWGSPRGGPGCWFHEPKVLGGNGKGDVVARGNKLAVRTDSGVNQGRCEGLYGRWCLSDEPGSFDIIVMINVWSVVPRRIRARRTNVVRVGIAENLDEP